MADTKELRGDAPSDLVCALDALALAEDMTRNAYVVSVLSDHVAKVLHKHHRIGLMLKDNPLLMEPGRSKPEVLGSDTDKKS